MVYCKGGRKRIKIEKEVFLPLNTWKMAVHLHHFKKAEFTWELPYPHISRVSSAIERCLPFLQSLIFFYIYIVKREMSFELFKLSSTKFVLKVLTPQKTSSCLDGKNITKRFIREKHFWTLKNKNNAGLSFIIEKSFDVC